jgi:hypothetical protein
MLYRGDIEVSFTFVQRRIRFKMSTLLVVVSFACIVMAWFGIELRRSVSELRVSEDLHAIGGRVHDYIGGPGSAIVQVSWLPEESTWLDRQLALLSGRRLGFHARTVEFGAGASTSDIKLLAQLPRARVIVFLKANVVEETINVLAKLDGIRCLKLLKCKVSSDAFQAMSKLRSIRVLEIALDGTRMTVPLEFTSEMQSLQVLVLSGATVQLDGLHPPKPDELKGLGLDNCRIDRNLALLRSFRNLRRVGLRGTNMSAESVESLAALPTLELIDFRDNMVSDDDRRKLQATFGDRIWLD